MSQTAAVTATMAEDDTPEAIPTATGIKQPILVPEFAEVKGGLQSAAKRAGMNLIAAHNMNVSSVQLDVADTKQFVDTAKGFGAKQVYLWKQALHPRATWEAHMSHLEEAISETDGPTGDAEEREAQQELSDELTRAKQVLDEHGTLLWGAGFLADGVMHEVYITEQGLVDALVVLSMLLDVAGGQDDDDLDDDLHELDPDEGARRIIEHVEEEMDVPPREMRRRANELARQAAHQLTEGDELGPADRQRVQQAIKLAAVRMRKG